MGSGGNTWVQPKSVGTPNPSMWPNNIGVPSNPLPVPLNQGVAQPVIEPTPVSSGNAPAGSTFGVGQGPGWPYSLPWGMPGYSPLAQQLYNAALANPVARGTQNPQGVVDPNRGKISADMGVWPVVLDIYGNPVGSGSVAGAPLPYQLPWPLTMGSLL